MNKKKLSVVMAGAMLATSVAPVLAATESTLPESYKVLLATNIEAKMNEKKISTHAAIKNVENGYVSKDVSDLMVADSSAYGIRILNADGTEKVKLTYKISDAKKAILAATAGETIEVYERETSTFYGHIIPGTEVVSRGTASNQKFESDAFSDAKFTTTKENLMKKTYANVYVSDIKQNDDKTSATVITKAKVDYTNPNSAYKTFQIKAGEAMPDFNLPLNSEGKAIAVSGGAGVQNFDKFAELQTWTASQKSIKDDVKVESVKLETEVSDTNVNYDINDLYDGFLLTSKGNELLDEIVNTKKSFTEAENKDGKKNVKIDSIKDNISTFGFATFKVEFFKDSNGNESIDGDEEVYKTVNVSAKNLAKLTGLHSILLNPENAKVAVVAGANRYETAVAVAKKQGAKIDTSSDEKNIVLVNGMSLVDGLAAAPLAAVANGNGKLAAPVLLSETDKLPAATKEYITELVANETFKDRSKVTINLVGGEGVLSSSLEKELKDMGFKVVRYGGDNREETSLEVAKKVSSESKSENAFVVGATAEADAMSISSVAASKNTKMDTKVTPIIVSSVHGLTKDAIKYLDAKTGDAVIVGGENAVSKSEEDAIAKVKEDAGDVSRIAGSNRKETNAKVIKEYYPSFASSKVIVVKDGMSNKSELVDALSAANLGGPIVLASDKLTDSQKNTLLSATGQATHLFQVGEGVSTSIVTELAQLLKVSNK